MPALTGLPSPISILTNVDIGTCASGEICVAKVFTDSASHVASSVVAEFRVLPASIVTALEDIVEAIDAGIEVDRFASNTMNSGLLISLTSASTRQGGTTGSVSAAEGSSGRSAVSTRTPSTQNASPDVVSNPSMSATTSVNSSGTGATISASNSSEANSPPANTHNTALNMAGSLPVTNKALGGSNRTRSGTPTASLPTGPVTYAVKITNFQGSVTNEIVQVGYS